MFPPSFPIRALSVLGRDRAEDTASRGERVFAAGLLHVPHGHVVEIREFLFLARWKNV